MMETDAEKNTPRERIAKSVTTLSIVGTIVLGVFALTYILLIPSAKGGDANLDKRIQIIQYVFTALLPLWGTWMGTVMAFYFSKENFLAANESVKNLVAQISPAKKLESTKCKDVMIPFDKIKPFPLDSSAPVEDNAADDATQGAETALAAFESAKTAADAAVADLDKANDAVKLAEQAKTDAEKNVAETTDPAEKTKAEVIAATADTTLADANATAAKAMETVDSTAATVKKAEADKTGAEAKAAEKKTAAESASTGPVDQLASIKILDALSFMRDNKITRLPLFKDKLLQYIIHQSTFEKFVTEVSTSKAITLAIDKATIGDMMTFGSDLIKGYLLNGAQFLDVNSNLKQAQSLIEKNIYCQDVFITTKGSASEDVLGWITNTIIAENAKDLKGD